MITGTPGSGKTTLGKKIAHLPNVKVVELDDIQDEIMLQNIDITSEDIKQEILLQDSIQKIIDKSTPNEILVFVGLMNDYLIHRVDYKFMINLDLDTIYERVNIRHLQIINDHYYDIQKLIKDKKYTPEQKDKLLLYKYKLRSQFPQTKKNLSGILETFIYYAINDHFEILTIDQIYKKIKRLTKI